MNQRGKVKLSDLIKISIAIRSADEYDKALEETLENYENGMRLLLRYGKLFRYAC